MAKVRVYFRITLFCLQRTREICLGDIVRWQGKRWVVYNGVTRPVWDLSELGGRRLERVNESEFRKERSFGNFVHDIRSTWRFYRGYWFDIWVRGLTGNVDSSECVRKHMPTPKRSP
jgi:hypothetical protein